MAGRFAVPVRLDSALRQFDVHHVSVLAAVLQNFAWLAVKMFANGFKGGKPDSLRLPSLEDRQVLGRDANAIGQVVQPHLPLGEDYIKVYDDGHGD